MDAQNVEITGKAENENGEGIQQVARTFGEEGKVLVKGFWRINAALNRPKDDALP